MADRTLIEWTDATWNPLPGCTKVTRGCDNCYAEAIARRFHRSFSPTFRPDKLDEPRRWKRPRMIFVNSVGDTFHTAHTNEQIGQVFDAMFATPRHTYQVLTKRPNRVRRWWEWYRSARSNAPVEWPENIWLGTSVESSELLPRIDRIAGIAPVTFLSAEPLLGPLCGLDHRLATGSLQWVIVGGESGPHARAMDPAWVAAIQTACEEYDVPFFFKQWGGRTPKSGGRDLDGRTWSALPSPALLTL